MFFQTPPFISMNEHHPPNPTKHQHHNIIEDKEHICVSQVHLVQYLEVQPICLEICSVTGYLKKYVCQGKRNTFAVRPGIGWGRMAHSPRR